MHGAASLRGLKSQITNGNYQTMVWLIELLPKIRFHDGKPAPSLIDEAFHGILVFTNQKLKPRPLKTKKKQAKKGGKKHKS
jgi:hypothetical protein